MHLAIATPSIPALDEVRRRVAFFSQSPREVLSAPEKVREGLGDNVGGVIQGPELRAVVALIEP